MKKILVAVMALIPKATSGKINFFAEAPTFYGKNESSELSKSTPIETYNQLIADSRVSSEKAVKAYKQLHAIRSIRTAIGKKYPGANLLERRTGNAFGGFFGFGAPEDYTEAALDIIEGKLAEAAKTAVSKDPLEKIRTQATEAITPLFTEDENEKLNKLVELESLWGTDEENEKNSIQLLELAQAIGVQENIKELLPQSIRQKEEPVVKEPEALVEPEPKTTREPETTPRKPEPQKDMPGRKIPRRPKQPEKRPPSKEFQKALGKKASHQATRASLEASLEKLTDALQKLSTATPPPQ